MTKFEHFPDFLAGLEQHHPGLTALARRAVTHREKGEDGAPGTDSFLWEHTLHTAALAYKISRTEGLDPRLPVIAALFHDAGKFENEAVLMDIPEERIAAETAVQVLTEQNLEKKDITRVAEAIQTLYRDGRPANPITDVIHDADFLSKSGHLGVAAFFIKNTLRGRDIKRSICEHLSKELTYAASLEGNMRTGSGKQIAAGKSQALLDFYTGLLAELAEYGIGSFEIEELAFPCPRSPDKKASIRIVLPSGCAACRGRIIPSFSTREGIKCLKLIARMECRDCGSAYEIAFCLPEMLCS